ncbi:MAG: hypothetical protein LAP87_20210 [Acidobacteriia bacterium]|nr:hypothetical protein [Terriglobia bacterium]
MLALLTWPLLAGAQTSPELAPVLERLDRLERANSKLSEEVQALRAELAAVRGNQGASGGAAVEAKAAPEAAVAGQPTVAERLDIAEQRIEEQAQTKVESSQKFPVRFTGIALFNAFANSRQSGGTADYPTVAAAQPGAARSGAGVRQTILGLEFRGPNTLWGGDVHGSVYMDFFDGSTTLDQFMRLRTASLEIDWKDRSVLAGIEKPIFNPREPNSLAQMGVSPLTSTGNLWLWVPQVRVEQDFSFAAATGLRARLGVVQTNEIGPYAGSEPGGSVERARPGLEGRFEFYHNFDDERRLEFAPGFHVSTTHIGGMSIPSQVFSLDWFFNPWQRVEFSGAFFTGQNVALLGSAVKQGFGIENGLAEAVHSRGGWGQFTIHAAKRLDFHLFTGQQDDDNGELVPGSIGKNLLWGGNLYYHLAPNVVLGLETTQVRTVRIAQGTRLNNHYDLALGYFF